MSSAMIKIMLGRNALSPAIAREAQHKKMVRKRVMRVLNHSVRADATPFPDSGKLH